MEMSPQEVRSISFSTVKRGYDSGEVTAFVEEVATALEAAQNETSAMEARARAAVARLQELSRAGDDAETISCTLLLAQRTADATVTEAHADAERIVSAAYDDAAKSLDQAKLVADKLIEDAKDEASKSGEDERLRVESEVQALSVRRDFLESDVDHLEAFLFEQRERIRESATVLSEFLDRVPGGLGAQRRPLLSASRADTAVAAHEAAGERSGVLESTPAGSSSTGVLMGARPPRERR